MLSTSVCSLCTLKTRRDKCDPRISFSLKPSGPGERAHRCKLRGCSGNEYLYGSVRAEKGQTQPQTQCMHLDTQVRVCTYTQMPVLMLPMLLHSVLSACFPLKLFDVLPFSSLNIWAASEAWHRLLSGNRGNSFGSEKSRKNMRSFKILHASLVYSV